MPPPLVGLTGGIASGKSSIAKYFSDLGIPIIDADQLSRDLMTPGTEYHQQIVSHFGSQILRTDGSLDRIKLGQLIFADPKERCFLEKLLHPAIENRMIESWQSLRRSMAPYVIYNAALLVESGIPEQISYLIVVRVDSKTQLKRLCRRDHLSIDEAKMRISAQLPLETKLSIADFVIDNNGTRKQTQQATLELHKHLAEHLADFKNSKTQDQRYSDESH